LVDNDLSEKWKEKNRDCKEETSFSSYLSHNSHGRWHFGANAVELKPLGL
jgi:hypothetical protein